jgi:hypothetical protein
LRQFHASFAGLRKANRDRLLRIANTMLPFSHVVDFFPNELAGLGARGLSFAGVLACTFNRFFFRHCRLLGKMIFTHGIFKLCVLDSDWRQ